MKITPHIIALGLALTTFEPAFAQVTPESALNKYCEPLISGATAAQITKSAKAAGFAGEKVGGRPVLRLGELILAVSDTPRVCFVQAPASMTFAQGISLVNAWAARHPGAMEGKATRGPDGAPVKMWAAPKQSRYLLVTEQSNGRGQKVLNFILAPFGAKAR